ncbi:MAG: elongation factor P [Planctomycetes bacterium]|nr:elongation factor P [Planctomycetota bacterium]
MAIKAIDLRRGAAVGYKDGIWVCIDNQKVAKGNWRSYQVIQLKNVQTGQLIEERFRTDHQFEEAFLDRKQMEYLYSAGSNLVVMDPDSYEQIELPTEMIGDKAVYLTPNLVLEVAFVDGKPVTVELPNTVELTVVDTPPQLKGATATNQLKDALCEGGARIKVPPFVENGTVVKVDTRTGEYLGRA